MIEVKSYVGSINVQSGSTFTLVNEYTGTINDPRHIDGAIELTIDNYPLINKDQWDLLDQLWMYIVSALENITNRRSYTSYFPDSPTKLSLRPVPVNMVEITVGDNSITYSSHELGNALLNGAEDCLKELSRIMNNSNLYREEIQKINRVRRQLTDLLL